MATPVIMPKQGQSVESCIITKWNKQVGDKVQIGDILFSYETDKASFEEEAKVEGTLLTIFFDEGDDVECLLNVCVIGAEGEDFASFHPKGLEEKGEPVIEDMKKETVQQVKEEVSQTIQTGELIKISPRAKNLAEKKGADIRYANPSGPNGRVIERDIEKVIFEGKVVTPGALDEYRETEKEIVGTGLGGRITIRDLTVEVAKEIAPSAEKQSQFEEVKLPNIRKIIAKSMHASLANSAQLTLNSSFDATEIIAFRKKLKDHKDTLSLPNITINDIILYAVSRALMNHKDMNAHFLGETMLRFHTANIGVACDTERGLMVPTLFHADQLTLNEISVKSRELTTACKDGTIQPDFLTGGTFTITNLGTLGIESFTPVLNPPQTGILGVCSITEKTKNGVTYPAMGLSLTFDHRAIDGAPAARFLQEVVKNLENFSLILAL